MRILAVLVVSLMLSACSTTLPINYVPSTSVRGTSPVKVSAFRYLPAEQQLVAPNQFQKYPVSIGEIYLGEDVSHLVESAVRKELSYAGYQLNDSADVIVSGDVSRFYYDWTGFVEVNFEVGIAFRVTKNGKVALESTTFSHQKAPKGTGLAQNPEAIRAAISDCIDQFLSEARKVSVL